MGGGTEDCKRSVNYTLWALFTIALYTLQVYLHNRTDLIETHLKPSLVEGELSPRECI